MKFKNKAILIYVIITVLCTWRLLIEYGPIGYRHDWSYPQFGFLMNNAIPNLLQVWKTDNLGVTLSYTSPFIYVIITSFPVLLGLGGVAITKLLVCFFLLGSAYFMFKLSSFFVKEKYAFISGLFYMLNPVLFNKIVAGHVTYLFSYTIAPLCFLFFIKSKNNYRMKILSGLTLSLVFTQIQFFVMFPLIMIIYCTFNKGYIKNFLIALSISLLIHSFWIIPLITEPGDTIETLSSATTLNLFFERTPKIFATPLLIGYAYFTWAAKELLILTILGGLGLLITLLFSLKSKNKQISTFIVITIIGLLLANGTNPPLGELFTKIPFINLFREVPHLMFITSFGYSILLGISAEKLKNKAGIITALVLLFAIPFLTGNFGKQVQLYEWDVSYGLISESLLSNNENYRVLWMPMNQPIKPLNKTFEGVDPMIAFSAKPSFTQIIASESDSNRITAHLSNTITDELPINKLTSLLNIKYIILREDFVSNFSYYSKMNLFPEIEEKHNKDKYEYFKTYFNETKELIPEEYRYRNNTPETIFSNNNLLPIIYSADKSILTDNDLSILNNYESNRPAIFFVNQIDTSIIGLVDKIDATDNSIKIINASYIFKPSNYVLTSNAKEGWSSLYNYDHGWWWYNDTYTSKTYSSALTLNESSVLEIPFDVKDDYYDIYIKLTGKIRIDFNNQSFTLESYNNSWINLGRLTLNKSVFTIINNANESLLEEIRLAKENELNITKTQSTLKENFVTDFKRKSNSEIEVNINNTEPFFLVLSESFDNNWVATLNNTILPHYEVNGFANAFFINQTGDNKIIINYQKQYYLLFLKFPQYLHQ